MKKRRISTSVIVTRTTKKGAIEVLLQFKRRNASWEFPGGKLDGKETTEECAWRELMEETDINAYFLDFRTHIESDNYLEMVFWARAWNRTPKLMEPKKHSALGWFKIDALPEPLTWYTATAIEQGVLESIRAAKAPEKTTDVMCG